jgi:hypothetical protein
MSGGSCERAASASNPARQALGTLARGGSGAAVAAGILLCSPIFAPASSAQTAVAGNSRAAGGSTAGIEWAGFAGNAQHTAVAAVRPQPFKRIRWRAKVDQHPVLDAGDLLVHYGSPMITAANTVLVPTRISAKAGFRVVAYSGTNGVRRWSLNTDYRPPAFTGVGSTWTPPLPAVLTPSKTLAVAGAGGSVLLREHVNSAVGAVHRLVFYGAAQWKAHRSTYDKAVQITTPLTAGPDGSLYFGFTVTGATPAHLSNGIARIDAHGHATWITAAAAAPKRGVTGVAINCAPALSPSGANVYVTVTSPTRGILVGLSATTLKPQFHAVLRDPVTGRPAVISPSSSASPVVGPDGDVYYGVLENPFPSHDDRGWLLHYNATLTRTKIPGSFGWDNTPSVLPAQADPSYHGSSPYLLVSKYNNYLIGPHGNGHNEMAVLDPRSKQKDPYSSARVMKAVQTILSPVHQPKTPAGARYEWCINSAVVDIADDSVIVNSEDGILYRWNLAHNTLAESIRLNRPRGEAYTPTIIGPDGTVYAINNADLYAIGR